MGGKRDGRINAPDGCRSRLPSVSTGREGGRMEGEGRGMEG
jgi:hypothetical protein